MEAPDILFIDSEELKDVFDPEYASFIAWNTEPLYPIEYIRKEALLEWAKEEQAKCSSETHPYYKFMNVLIEKLKDFRP